MAETIDSSSTDDHRLSRERDGWSDIVGSADLTAETREVLQSLSTRGSEATVEAPGGLRPTAPPKSSPEGPVAERPVHHRDAAIKAAIAEAKKTLQDNRPDQPVPENEKPSCECGPNCSKIHTVGYYRRMDERQDSTAA